MYKQVLVPLDGSPLAECVFPHVEHMAQSCGAEEIILIRVVKPFYLITNYVADGISGVDVNRVNEEAMNEAKEYLEKVAAKFKFDSAKVRWEVIMGIEADTIADFASEKKVDLIIIATHGRSGISRWVWGSVADRVLRSSCVPVLMVRAPGCVPGV